MRADRYLAFLSTEIARSFLDRLHSAMQHREVWTEPNVHPFEDRAVIPWNDAYLAQYSHLLESIDQVSLEQARDQGFIFGRLKGPFAHARAKLEEAQLLQEALAGAASLPNFPVYRSLFFGQLSAMYALKEALKQSCKRLGAGAEAWFEEQFQRLKADPLVWAFYQMNNENKHKPEDLPLRSYLKATRGVRISGCPQGARILMSNEGILGIVHEGTGRERVVALAGSADVSWQVVLEMPDRDIGGPATPLAEQVLRFYEALVFEARRRFGGETELAP
jgi:hypothetical protein